MGVTQRGPNDYVVTDSSGKQILGEHPTSQAAHKQLHAIEKSKESRGKKKGLLRRAKDFHMSAKRKQADRARKRRIKIKAIRNASGNIRRGYQAGPKQDEGRPPGDAAR